MLLEARPETLPKLRDWEKWRGIKLPAPRKAPTIPRTSRAVSKAAKRAARMRPTTPSTPTRRRELAQKAFADVHGKIEREMDTHLRAWQLGRFRTPDPRVAEAEWRRRCQKSLRKAYFNSYRAGKIAATGDAKLTAAEIKRIEKELRAENKYLRKFGRDLKKPEYLQGAKAMQRQGMYSDGARGMYNAAFLAGADPEKAVWWVMTPAEHCEDCLRLAAGSPYRQAGAEGKRVADLPELRQVPGDGQTRCVTNCKCFLRVGRIKSAEPIEAETESDAWLRGEELLSEHGHA